MAYHNGHSDKTADSAIGSVTKEWKQMAAIAIKIREGRCNPVWADEHIPMFTGIFKRLLEDPIDEVRIQAKMR